MRTETVYIADDETRFATKWECLNYEAQKAEPKLTAVLKDYVALFGGRKVPLPYRKQSCPSYVYVKQIPNWDDEDFMSAWNQVVPEVLTEEIEQYEAIGWYVMDEGERWHFWGNIERMIQRYKDAFAEMDNFL